MKIGIFGLGYVGATSAACLARNGHDIVGIDNNAAKAEALTAGRLSFVEPHLEELVRNAVAAGRLTIASDAAQAVEMTDCSLICVGTPPLSDGSLDTRALVEVVCDIAVAMKRKAARHVLIVRSTILPGTMDEMVLPIIERRTGLVAGRDYGLSYFPEFMREGSAIADYDAPGTVVYSASDAATAALLAELNGHVKVEHHCVSLRTAEAAKLLNNGWHAAKVSFANEFGLILKALNIDSHEAFSILCADTKLNISPAYLKPGFAYGGSCLPKDLDAMRNAAHKHGLATPYIDGIDGANRNQRRYVVDLVAKAGHKRVALIGLAFKAGTDDLRNSPYVDLAGELLALGCELRIVDEHLDLSRLVGANSAWAQKLPDLEHLLCLDIDAALAGSDVLIVADRRQAEKHIALIARYRPHVIDLVRSAPIAALGLGYDGICWAATEAAAGEEQRLTMAAAV